MTDKVAKRRIKPRNTKAKLRRKAEKVAAEKSVPIVTTATKLSIYSGELDIDLAFLIALIRRCNDRFTVLRANGHLDKGGERSAQAIGECAVAIEAAVNDIRAAKVNASETPAADETPDKGSGNAT